MKIIKSFRKTIAISVDRDGIIIVKAPHLTSKSTINNFIEKHKDWIQKRQSDILNNQKTFHSGERFYYFGKEFPIYLDEGIKKPIFTGEEFVFPKKYEEKLKEKLIDFYKKEAKKYIEDRLEYISKINNLEYSNMRISSAKTRWGSCSTKKNLNFTFRLIMSPPDTIDYVIIHELAHLKHMNHSKRFRDEVQLMSDRVGLVNYKISKKWLKENANKISYV